MTSICRAFCRKGFTRLEEGEELEGFNPHRPELAAGFQSRSGGKAPNTEASCLTTEAAETGSGGLIRRILERARGIGFCTYHCLGLPLRAWRCAHHRSLWVRLRTISSTKRRGTSTWSF